MHIFFLICGLSFVLNAQEKLPMTAAQTQDFVAKMVDKSQKMAEVKTQFTQQKHSTVLTSVVESTGNMRFNAKDKYLRWAYKTPQVIVFELDKDNVSITGAGGKPLQLPAAAKRGVSMLAQMIMQIVNGQLLIDNKNKDFQPSYFRSGSNTLIELKAKSNRMKRAMVGINMLINSELEPISIEIIENGGDRTVIHFDQGMEISYK